MIRHILNISNYKYVCDLYDAYTDMKNEQYTSTFVMLRVFTLNNNVVCDDDIYFVDTDVFDEYIEDLKSHNDIHNTTSRKLIFPITTTQVQGYSQDYLDYNSTYTHESFFNEDNEYGYDVYKIYELKNGILSDKKIRCNRIRIYHPSIHKNMKAVVEVENYINNVHFHYVCKRLEDIKTNSETEFRVNNNIYSEFVDIYFPNIDDLFAEYQDGTYAAYYREDLNIVASTENAEFINKVLYNGKDVKNYDFTDDVQIVPLALLVHPSRIIKEIDPVTNEETFVKLYVKINKSIYNNYINHPINVNIYPYDTVNKMTNLYMLSETLSPITEHYVIGCKFRLMSKFGFSNGIVSVINEFDYPLRDYYNEKYGQSTITTPIHEAYKKYNNVTDEEYDTLKDERYRQLYSEIINKKSLTAIEKQDLMRVANRGFSSNKQALEEWKRLQIELINEEFAEEVNTPLDFIGFNIRIATDIGFKQIIYNDNISVKLSELDDLCFKLNGIFDNWNQMPETLIVQVKFVDRYLNISLVGNFVVISKEWFKYMINDVDCGVYRLSKLTSANDNMKEIELNKGNINFINNITCVIHKDDDHKLFDGKLSQANRMLYKPIFYRTQDLQSIKLRAGFEQNIGVNLAQYMTKVDTFKMLIDDFELEEFGRNDIYVIFKIPVTEFSKTSGRYNISNQDDEYISSGSWTII